MRSKESGGAQRSSKSTCSTPTQFALDSRRQRMNSAASTCLVNNVGTIVWKDLESLSPQEWRSCIDGTLYVTLFASQAALPFLRASARGRIVNILDADADASNPVPYATAYKIGKKAAWQLTKTMAVVEAPNGLTINAVAPGTLEDSGEKPALDRMPAGRYGRYADVEGAVLYFASEEAAYVTGTMLKVSGGYLA